MHTHRLYTAAVIVSYTRDTENRDQLTRQLVQWQKTFYKRDGDYFHFFNKNTNEDFTPQKFHCDQFATKMRKRFFYQKNVLKFFLRKI